MATLLPPPSKRMRRDAQLPRDTNVVPADLPAVQVQFRAADTGKMLSTGMMRVPGSSTVKQLEMLINSLLGESDDPTPYTFSLVDGATPLVINSDIYSDILRPKHRTTEDVLTLEYVPQAIFKVKSVSRCSATMSGHGGTILSMAFSPKTSTRLITGSGDGTARVWDSETGTPVAAMKGHDKWVLCVAWSPDGELMATGSMDCSVRIWDIKTGKQIGQPMRGHSKWITSLSFEPLHLLDESQGLRLVSSSKDATLKVWDVTSRTCIQTLSGHTACITSAKWSGLGVIYSCSQDKTIKVWDARKSTIILVKTLNAHAHWVNFVALSTEFAIKTGGFDPFNKENSDDSAASLRTKAKQRFTKAATQNGVINERIVTASDDMTMYLWNPFPSGIVDRSAATVNAKPVARMVGHQKAINHVAFSADGRILASCSFDNSIKLWDGKTGTFLSTLRGHVAAVYMCSWSADSRLLASGSKDCTVKVWDVRQGKLHADLPGHKDEVYAIEWSADGKVVASGGRDKTIKLWQH
ncbi:quinon protein alcohol dehydrogenase-like superfamily [Lipomyces arxii]|uniref:quinon protein alcohol dehydrogenase-like superfamily n=1 Tax=Lipomyces arxii TaxID=56418 RepID=UPI0034CDDE35